MKNIFANTGMAFLLVFILASWSMAADSDSLVVDESGNVGIQTSTPLEPLHVNGRIRANSSIITHPSQSVPDDLWGGPYLINQTGFIGHMGSNNLDIVWNGYRRTSDNKYNVLGIGGSDTINAIRLGDTGIRFDSQEGLANGADIPSLRMFISTKGNIGIGTSSADERLTINGGGIKLNSAYGIGFKGDTPYDSDVSGDKARIYYNGSFINDAGDYLVIEKTDGHSTDPDGGIVFTNKGSDNIADISLIIRGTGKVGIGLQDPQENLDVAGLVRSDGSILTSDIRWKENIETIDNATEIITQLRGVTYDWIDPSRGEGRQIGVIAQEVEQVLPEIVHTDSQGYKSVEYAKLVAPLIEAVKELNAEVDNLRDENEQLLAENQTLKQANQNIEARVAEIERLLSEK